CVGQTVAAVHAHLGERGEQLLELLGVSGRVRIAVLLRPVPAVAELVVVGGQVDREADDRAVVGDVAPLVLANVGEVGPLVDVVAGQVGGQVGEGAVADGTGRLRRVHQLHDVGQVAPCQQGRQAFVIVGGRSDLRPVVDVQPLVVRLPEHV